MTQNAPPETVGVRIARARKRRGLTQVGLASKSQYSRGHIAQVEAGQKIATPSFVAAAAAALGMDAAELYGQPYQARGHDDRVHAFIPELRRVLAYVDVGPELEGQPRDLDVLAAEVATARRLLLDAKLSRLGGILPSVLEELTYYAYETDDRAVWVLLSRGHYAAVSLARRLGYTGDALALMDRAMDAARRSQDPHLPLVVTLPRTLLLMSMDQTRPALTLLDRASAQIDPGLPDADEVAGALELRSAITAARSPRNASRAWDYHGRALDRVWSKTHRAPVHDLQFTAANVAVHGVAVAVELGDLDEAARRDHEIGERTLNALPPERRAHHEIDMSRVHVEVGDYGKALERLASADRIAPQMVTFHPTARSVVAHLVDVRRSLPESLRRLHSRMSA
ncbi:helix-turn-helix transcriptional regulator [Spirillospora sp. NPDC052269]